MTDISPVESALITVYEATSNFLRSVANLPPVHSTLPTVIKQAKERALVFFMKVGNACYSVARRPTEGMESNSPEVGR